ncbi:fasciclin domain-containing protein [Kordia algicida OT-1]|uniref:Beta-Ig-H3/fasciclin n=1 Tax=Kordia algicida OT-1 TaxID=391587 RepID=A9E3N2_9FLAO|nr:fasciclin domain-containing protein [Kordia algicida]EDP95242.1 Beta-Ig-H3/fasciclin [Kordia algicida OT-1]
MKKKTTSILMAFIIAVFTLTSCSNDDDNNVVVQSNTIADIVVNSPNYSSLLAALERTDLTAVLDGSTEYTVFAPDNDAFDAFLQANGFASLEAVPTDVLTQVLLNHVVAGTNTASNLSTGYVKTLAEESTTGNNLDLYINTSTGVVLNGDVNVVTADITADNGVVHAVNKVIGLPTVVTFATADSTFGILVQALTRESSFTYVETLSLTTSPAPFTVFAPTDQAFVDLLTELEVSSLADIDAATLEATLNTHVVAGANVLSSTLSDGMMVNTLGDNFTINTEGGASFTDQNGRTGDIIVTDVQAANGVIHVVSRVILPSL